MLTPEIKLKIAACSIFILAAMLISGCSSAGSDEVNDFLIKVGDRKVSMHEFNRAFEVVKMAYANDIFDDPQLVLEAKSQLLKEMIEQQLIMKRAEELQMEVSEEELDAAVSEIKADYPENSFEQMLLENAVSFAFWKESLKSRLLKQKVIAKEIMENISISPKEIEEFYVQCTGNQNTESEPETDAEMRIHKIVSQLRRKKAKEVYPDWIRSLREKYGVTINKAAWE